MTAPPASAMLDPVATDDWGSLMAHLDTLGTLVPAAGGRIHLALADRVVTVLVTPAQWDDTVGVVWAGDVDGALQAVSRAVRAIGPDDRFLVFESYELHPSASEETPLRREDRETLRRIEEIRRRDPDAELGWYAERSDGGRARFPEPPR